MPTNIGGSVIQLSLRGDTLARWTSFNPVLGEREMVIETDTRRFKIGNGTNAYTSLPYAGVTAQSDVMTTVGTTIDLSAAKHFKKTITANTTLAVANAQPSGFVSQFDLRLTNAGAYTVTLFSGIKWAGGAAPTLTVSGTDNLRFTSDDGGTTWHGYVMSLDSK